ncbi:MAG: hypothetical protein E7474_02385 [Ruminococcaceae bacterium]|nr:hypothetical protein [Oscillospiraceae bacterium]
MKDFKKWEISVMIGVIVTILWCAASPRWTPQWWTTAFSPLCDGILTADASGEGIILRSWLWEQVSKYLF